MMSFSISSRSSVWFSAVIFILPVLKLRSISSNAAYMSRSFSAVKFLLWREVVWATNGCCFSSRAIESGRSPRSVR